MSRAAAKLWWRLLRALRLIDKPTLKARIWALKQEDGGDAGASDFRIAFARKFGKELIPGEHVFDVGRVEAGEGSYGPLNVLASGDSPARLSIGRYCSIAPGVTFILEDEHPYRGLSTYPFKVKRGFAEHEAVSKGDIRVGDDVWLGLGATVCSGVAIGQGAIVAAGSVVVKDVPPYAIVGGNPAKFIKWRFEDAALRERLAALDWGRFDPDALTAKTLDTLYAPLDAARLDTLEALFFPKTKGDRP